MPRIPTSCLIALLIFSSGAIYIYSQPKIYQAVGLLQVWAPITSTSSALQPNYMMSDVTGTALSILQSKDLATKVLDQLNNIAPTNSAPVSSTNFIFERGREEYTVHVICWHTDQRIAVKSCNLYMQEYIKQEQFKDLEGAQQAIIDLTERIDQQNVPVRDAETKYQQLKQQLSGRSSLKEKTDLNSAKRNLEVQISFQQALEERLNAFEDYTTHKTPPSNQILHSAVIQNQEISPHTPIQLVLSLLLGISGGCFSFFAWGRFRSAQ